MSTQNVTTFQQLEKAVLSKATEINIANSIVCTHSIILPPGTSLRGTTESGHIPMLSFTSGDGIGVTADNAVANLFISAPEKQKAIFNAFSDEDLGIFRFENLRLTGMFSFVARKGTEKAEIIADNIDIVSADARANFEQPQKFGVNPLQGAFTVYNYNKHAESNITLTASNISAGREGAPVKGSGIFISGAGDEGGWVTLKKLTTKDVFSNGLIAENTSTIIAAAVFIVNGVKAENVLNEGKCVTYGSNDRVLDNWGEVQTWEAYAPIISYGPSSIGFVNFGTVENFTATAPLQTFGMGSRGYNQYDGSAQNVTFKSIETFGDGSTGVQLSKKIGVLNIQGSLVTHGGKGNTLVKGKNVELPAIALSLQEGGSAEAVTVGGNIETHGDDVATVKIEKGASIGKLQVEGEILATGKNAKTIENASEQSIL